MFLKVMPKNFSALLRKLSVFAERLSSKSVFFISAIMIALLGFVDYVTGYEISFSVFYLVPVAFASWYSSPGIGLTTALTSAVIWQIVDISSGHLYSRFWIPSWNAGVRLGFFLTVSYLLWTLKKHVKIEEKMARTDSLTGTLNGRAFQEEVIGYLDVAHRQAHSVSLAYLDVDDFKTINDNFGHSIGDELLRQVATVLMNSLRNYDIIARLGGDEFAMFLPFATYDAARLVIERVRESLLEMTKERQWPVTCSIGLVTFSEIPKTVDEAIALADNAMYRVKRQSKNGILHERR